MKKFENNQSPEEGALRKQLEETRRTILDTKAEMAQAKADLKTNPSRASELEPLQRTLDTLEPISKLGQRFSGGIFGREARSSDEE